MLLDQLRHDQLTSQLAASVALAAAQDPAEDTVWIRHVPWAASYRSAEE
jgi:hypothetical protein